MEEETKDDPGVVPGIEVIPPEPSHHDEESKE